MGIKDLLGGGISKVLDSAKGVINTFIPDPAEKAKALQALENEANRHEEVLLKEANDLEKAYLADTQDARGANARIQESANASWLSKNIGYCIDIFLILVFCAMLIVIIFKVVPVENKELFYTSFGLLGSYVGQSINYHRGTSAGSHAKQKQLDNIMKK